MKISRLLLVAGIAMSLGACATVQSYVAPQPEQATLASLQQRSVPVTVAVTANWQTNGTVVPASAGAVVNEVESVLRQTRVLAPVSSQPGTYKATLTVLVNDVDDARAARHTGFVAGISLGSSSGVVTDKLTVSFKYNDGRHDFSRAYDHSVYSTVGSNVAPPVSANPVTPEQASAQVVRDATLNFVRDLQREGILGTGN